MVSLKKRIYTNLVNLNLWFTAGRLWVMLPITVLSLAGDYAILFIFLGIEPSPLSLVLLSLITAVSILLFGRALFKTTGTQIDHFMKMWQKPYYMIAWTGEIAANILVAKHMKIPVPEVFKKWCMDSWDDVMLIIDNIFESGEHAQALPIVQNFFKHQKSKMGLKLLNQEL